MQRIEPCDLPDSSEGWPYGTFITEIPTFQQARELLGPSNYEIRNQKSKYYFDILPSKARNRLRLSKHDQAEEYMFANGAIENIDPAGAKRHLPLHVKVIKYKTFKIDRGTVLDVTSSVDYWPGLDAKEELYTYVYIEKLIVEAEAKLIVHGNVFVLNCDEIVFEGESDESKSWDFEIRILGTHHPAYGRIRNFRAINGKNGLNGLKGSDASEIKSTPSIFGPIIEECSESDLNGENGTDGSEGEHGTHGQNGGMSMLADLRIRKLSNFGKGRLRIFGQASAGYTGGNGGDGGNGGNGGKPVVNPKTKEYGAQGKGGNGGVGGNGGHGGNGGLSSNIFIEIPKGYVECLELDSQDSKGGKGGEKGEGGLHGASDFLEKSIQERANSGKPGRNGRSRPGPAIMILSNAFEPATSV